MIDRRRTYVRRTTLPIWGMVTVAALTSGAALVIHARSLGDVDRLTHHIAAIRAGADDIDHAFDVFVVAVESEAARLLQPSVTTLGESSTISMPEPPGVRIAELITHVDGPLQGELRSELERTLAAVRETKLALSEASEWRRAWSAVESERTSAMRELQRDATTLRDSVAHIDGHRRLAIARGEATDRTVDGKALAAITTELLDLDIQTRALADATTVDALRDIEFNRLRPNLDRLDDVVAASGIADELGPIVHAMRLAAVGGEGRGAPSLAQALIERARLMRGGDRINDGIASLLERVTKCNDAIGALNRTHLTELGADLDRSIEAATGRNVLASGFGLAVLLILARALAGQVGSRTAELVNTVEELRRSRAELVHLSELRDALAKLEHANHEMSLQRSALDQAGVVCEANEAGTITYVNDLCCSLSGFAREEIIGTPQRLPLAAEHPPEHWEHVKRALSTKGRWRGVLCSRAKSGAPFWAQTTILALEDSEGKKRLVAIGTDISSQVAAEQTLEEQAASLAEARARAEEASIAKSAFLAAMSHEIRTPLNGVLGALDLLAEGSLDDRQRRYIQISQTSAETLMSIIDDILDFSKIEAGRLELSPSRFELPQLIEDVGGMLSMKALARGLELVVSVAPDLPHTVWGDAERLRQILINLVNNAIKFTEQGTVTVSVECAPTEDVSRVGIRVEVTDTGIGIPEDRIHLLFRSFSQTDASMSRRYGGSGLGLAICKRLAEMMGGAIGVRSQVGVGSTFWFTLPLERAIEQLPEDGPSLTTMQRGLGILIVDDNATVRDTLDRYCLSWGMRPTIAESVPAAIEVCEARALAGDPFAAILCDQTMSELDGFDLAAIVRSRISLRNTPLILMTPALDMNPELVRAAGFATHVAKPARQSEVYDAIIRSVTPSGAERPAATAHHGDGAAAKLPPPPPGRAWRILLAEDNEINQLIAREMLTNAGFELEIASDGHQTVTMAGAADYDLVLMDCQMPGMDGFDATRAIREAESARGELAPRHVPIIALTANALSGDRERCIDAGMDAYCSKPIVLHELLETAGRMLARGSTTISKAA